MVQVNLSLFWRRYWIVVVALVLSAVAFATAGSVPDWLIAGLSDPAVNPCSKLEALFGLHSRSERNKVSISMLRLCVRVRTDPAGFEQIHTPDGDFWIPAGNRSVLAELVAQQATGAYSSGPTRIHAGDIVLDGGAHVGVFTRTALNAGAKLVVAIEPAPENLACLRRNFGREIADGRVTIYAKGIWNADAVLPMHLNRNSAGDSFVLDLDNSRLAVNLPLTTVDKLVAELRLPRVDFIKLDIKGAEVQALEGAKLTLAKYRPRLAIASEHLIGDNVSIPRAVLAANRSYQVACGICYVEAGQIKPEVLHFW